MSAYDTIVATAKSIFEERGEAPPRISPETPILSSGLDSLDIALWWSASSGNWAMTRFRILSSPSIRARSAN